MESKAKMADDQSEAIKQLADEIFRDRVERARRMKPEEKLSAASELFEYAAKITLSGIHMQNPGISEARAREILAERLALKERMENSKWISMPPSS